MAQQDTQKKLTADDLPQKELEDACFHTLGLIGRNCEYLEQHFAATGADKASRQAVEDISAAAARLERTLNELMSALDYMRADVPELRPVDLCELLRQLAAQAELIQTATRVELELDCGGWTSCRVAADRSDVELLCLHLLSNALRACEPGGRVRIVLRRSETAWQLIVMDNGCGLPGTDNAALLENRRRFLGSARMGLLLCRESCRRMGWGLSVERAPERGTQAVVTIPLSVERGVRETGLELHMVSEIEREQQAYRLRAMLLRELRALPQEE